MSFVYVEDACELRKECEDTVKELEKLKYLDSDSVIKYIKLLAERQAVLASVINNVDQIDYEDWLYDYEKGTE